MSVLTRVLLVAPNLRGGGAERMLIELANGLSRNGHEVRILLFNGESAYPGLLSRRVSVEVFHDSTRSVAFSAPRLLHRLLRSARASDLVIAGLEGWPTTLAALACRLAGKPCIAWVHSDLEAYSRNWGVLQRGFHQWAYRLVRETVCVSKGAGHGFARFTHRRHQNVRVCYNAVPLENEAPPGRLSGLVPTVLAAGQLRCDQKGFDLLIQSHARLMQAGVKHKLVILGEGPDRHLLQDLCTALGVMESVTLPGFVNNIQHWYRQADVFACSSRSEGFSMVLLEAMAQGLPVVATDCRYGPREILEDGAHGLLVAAEDVEALTTGLRSLLTDDLLRQRLGEDALRRARQFSVQRFLDEWQNVLGEVALKARS